MVATAETAETAFPRLLTVREAAKVARVSAPTIYRHVQSGEIPGAVRVAHALRHRRISLLHHQGRSWAEVGELVGQRSRIVTADVYTHTLIDYREVDRPKLLERARTVPTPVHTSDVHGPSFAGTF